MISRNQRWLVLALVALAVAGYWWTTRTKSDGPSPVIATVTRGTIEDAVTAAGSLQPGNWVDVGAQVSGQLRAMSVDVGDIVASGDLLAEIDASVQVRRVQASEAGLQAEQAQVSARQAEVTLARSKLRRQRELIEQNLTSQNELDGAINQLAVAESALAALQSRIASSSANLASDQAQLGYSQIFAPMSGTVVSVEMTVGQTLNATQRVPTIMRIADLTSMTVRAEVSEADVGRIRVGTRTYFTTLGGGERRWDGSVRQILPTPTIVNDVVFYPVLFDVLNEDGALLPEMTAQVFFVISEATDVLYVPVGALRYEGGRADVGTVEVIATDESRELREVSVGLKNRISTEIVTGLDEGERVVAGAGRLLP